VQPAVMSDVEVLYAGSVGNHHRKHVSLGDERLGANKNWSRLKQKP